MKFNHLARHYEAEREGDSLTAPALKRYVDYLKEYVEHGTAGPADSGLCYYVDYIIRNHAAAHFPDVNAYDMWWALIETSDIAYNWHQKMVSHKGGRTKERIEMVMALLVELEEALGDAYASR